MSRTYWTNAYGGNSGVGTFFPFDSNGNLQLGSTAADQAYEDRLLHCRVGVTISLAVFGDVAGSNAYWPLAAGGAILGEVFAQGDTTWPNAQNIGHERGVISGSLINYSWSDPNHPIRGGYSLHTDSSEDSKGQRTLPAGTADYPELRVVAAFDSFGLAFPGGVPPWQWVWRVQIRALWETSAALP